MEGKKDFQRERESKIYNSHRFEFIKKTHNVVCSLYWHVVEKTVGLEEVFFKLRHCLW